MAIDRIYMDSNCFIESVKSKIGSGTETGRDNDLWHIKHLLISAERVQIEVITSYLTVAECRHAGTAGPTEEVKRLFRSILSSGKVVKLAQLTKTTAEFARDLAWTHNINMSGADAIHVETAIKTGCKEFLSFDFGKSKSPVKLAPQLKSLGLITIEPAETSLLPPTYRQPNFLAPVR